MLCKKNIWVDFNIQQWNSLLLTTVKILKSLLLCRLPIPNPIRWFQSFWAGFFLLTTVVDHVRSPIVCVLTNLSIYLASSSDHIIVPPKYVFKTGVALFIRYMEKNRLWQNYLFYANIKNKRLLNVVFVVHSCMGPSVCNYLLLGMLCLIRELITAIYEI